MATEPSNPGLIILLVLASIIAFAAFTAGLDDLSYSPSMLFGAFAGLAVGGIAFGAFQATPDVRPMMWVAFALAIPTLGFLILQGTNNDDGLGTMTAMIIASWLAMPFALALMNKHRAGGPPSPE